MAWKRGPWVIFNWENGPARGRTVDELSIEVVSKAEAEQREADLREQLGRLEDVLFNIQGESYLALLVGHEDGEVPDPITALKAINGMAAARSVLAEGKDDG